MKKSAKFTSLIMALAMLLTSLSGAPLTALADYYKTYDISSAEIRLSESSFVYTGEEIRPAATVYINGEYITLGNYNVEYSNNVNAGTATVTVTGKEDFMTAGIGTAQTTFVILPKVSVKKKMCTGSTQKLNVAGAEKYKFSSSDKKILTVDKNGTVKAKKKGKATVTVKANGVSSEVKITVKNPSLKLDSTKETIYVKDTYKLEATTYPSKKKVTWKSSNAKVATVSKSGKITAKKKGTATITASFKYKGKTYKKSCKVTVKKASTGSKGKSSVFSGTFYHTSDSTYVTMAYITNSGKYPMKIDGSTPLTYAYTAASPNDALMVDENLNYLSSYTIAPGKSAKLFFVTFSSHYYSYNSCIGLSFTYGGKEYIGLVYSDGSSIYSPLNQ